MDLSTGGVARVAFAVGACVVAAVPDAAAFPDAAAGGERRVFGVVDLSDPPVAPAVRQQVERAAAARGLSPLSEPAMQKALSSPEPPGARARRLAAEARRAREQGDCPAGLARAAEAESAALETLPIDDVRPVARLALAVALACADELGREAEARAASARLRRLGGLPPDGVSQALWERYAPPAPDAGKAGAAGELIVDSDPPNAHVAIDFRRAGVTPLSVPSSAGPVTIELEKTGYKKAVRRVLVQAGRAPTRVTVALGERRLDRAAEIARRLSLLRGSDPARGRAAFAQLAQLARVDVLVAFVERAGALSVWWFDADRGDFVGAPTHLALPAN